MVNRLSAHLIAYLCYHIDNKCRQDLHLNNIVSERDYVSNLATHLRSPLGPFFNCQIAQARTLPQNLETTFGCDSIIIFKRGDVAKVGLFEAKWPRYFINRTYPWDSLRTNGDSRFSSQIIRQHNWINSGAVIWEMFFNESSPGPVRRPFDNFGSSCLLHDKAFSYYSANKNLPGNLWDSADLIRVMPHSINFKRIVYHILCCNFGIPFLLTSTNLVLRSSQQPQINVPIVGKGGVPSESSEVLGFMEETGITTYISVDITDHQVEQ